jgi:hypothetical protein
VYQSDKETSVEGVSDRVLRKTVISEEFLVTEYGRDVHNEELWKFYSSPDIV